MAIKSAVRMSSLAKVAGATIRYSGEGGVSVDFPDNPIRGGAPEGFWVPGNVPKTERVDFAVLAYLQGYHDGKAAGSKNG